MGKPQKAGPGFQALGSAVMSGSSALERRGCEHHVTSERRGWGDGLLLEQERALGPQRTSEEAGPHWHRDEAARADREGARGEALSLGEEVGEGVC